VKRVCNLEQGEGLHCKIRGQWSFWNYSLKPRGLDGNFHEGLVLWVHFFEWEGLICKGLGFSTILQIVFALENLWSKGIAHGPAVTSVHRGQAVAQTR
jgi:hypothetical protein